MQRAGAVLKATMAIPDDEDTARRAILTTTDTNPARAAEVVVVTSHRVACDGVGGALGHPRVYIELGEDGAADCGYCDRRFVLAGHAKAESERLAPGVYEGPGGH